MTVTERQRHILVLDGSQEILRLFRDLLEREGHRVSVAPTASTHLDHVKRLQPDVIILDFMTGGGNAGGPLLEQLKQDAETAHIPIIVSSGAVQIIRDGTGPAARSGVRTMLEPFDTDDLLHTTDRCWSWLIEEALTPVPAGEPP